MPRRLLPLNGLRAFEASARHLSFKAAAEELNVTPAAISHQVKALEDMIGQKLFRRLTRQLVLTEAAQLTLPDLQQGFEHLSRACRLLESETQEGILTISVAPSFGAKWLVPRLVGFQEAHPEIEVRVAGADHLVDFDAEDVDAGVRFGRGDYEGLHVERLFAVSVVPVCCPSLTKGDLPLRQPADLKHHTLLHYSSFLPNEASPAWSMWLKAAGLEGIEANRGPKFNSYTLLAEAALAGQGVALIDESVVSAEIASGRLTRLFCDQDFVTTKFSYYLVYPLDRACSRKIELFRDWILGEACRFRSGDTANM
ncbi:MAG: transcriptional regulator GcvA [Kiloniellales bacterium]